MKGDGGVYVFRGRRPGLLGRTPYSIFPVIVLLSVFSAHLLHLPWWFGGFSLLLSPRHTMYVGEGRVSLRRSIHLRGSEKYKEKAKPWSDLSPSHYSLPLPYRKWLLRSAETLLILLLAPVYNHQKNQWNPRRIPLSAAKLQRAQRDRFRWSFNVRAIHVIELVIMIGVWFQWG